jgi:hypothetical protein
MRYLMLLLASLFFLACGPALLGAGKSRPEKVHGFGKKSSSPAPDRVLWEEKVTGYGQEESDAKKVALEQARQKVSDYLHDQYLALEWKPSLDYVQEKLVKGTGQPGTDKKLSDKLTLKSWVLPVTITERDYQDMLRLDRTVRAQQRMFWLGRILAGVVLVLTGVLLYLRLDEWTQGSYTAWLRLAALSLLGGIGIGLWWMS